MSMARAARPAGLTCYGETLPVTEQAIGISGHQPEFSDVYLLGGPGLAQVTGSTDGSSVARGLSGPMRRIVQYAGTDRVGSG
jgi:hypothetical protein